MTPTPLPFPFLDASTGSLLFPTLVLATLISEDVTCFTAGLLVAAGRADWFSAVAACFVGITLGDAGVWLVGRTAGTRTWVTRRLAETRLVDLSHWLAQHGGKVAFAARFLPGTRVPLLLTAGVMRPAGLGVLMWSFVAALVWVPFVVLSVAEFGAALPGWLVFLLAVSTFLGLRTLPKLFTRVGRAKLLAKLSKLWRWEFWPAWVFYLPLVPWWLILSVRYRSFTVWTAANPGIPAGGVVGESKADILAKLPPEWIIPTLLVPEGDHADRMRLVREALAERGWGFPLVLKPDVGERGSGVRKVNDETDVEKYLFAQLSPVLVQPYHAGPFEAGVFYYRLPHEATGRIFSITDKVFPVVLGDGHSTLAELIWAHPRYRMQADMFLAKHAADAERILAVGERFSLTVAGNHCQGTLFRDGSFLFTPQLEAAFDGIAKQFDGFFIGRFDVRYSDPVEFRAGRGFDIVELNGVTSESTNLYDPSWNLWQAYRVLFRQWTLLFRIGDGNRRRGSAPSTVLELVGLFDKPRAT